MTDNRQPSELTTPDPDSDLAALYGLFPGGRKITLQQLVTSLQGLAEPEEHLLSPMPGYSDIPILAKWMRDHYRAGWQPYWDAIATVSKPVMIEIAEHLEARIRTRNTRDDVAYSLMDHFRAEQRRAITLDVLGDAANGLRARLGLWANFHVAPEYDLEYLIARQLRRMQDKDPTLAADLTAAVDARRREARARDTAPTPAPSAR